MIILISWGLTIHTVHSSTKRFSTYLYNKTPLCNETGTLRECLQCNIQFKYYFSLLGNWLITSQLRSSFCLLDWTLKDYTAFVFCTITLHHSFILIISLQIFLSSLFSKQFCTASMPILFHLCFNPTSVCFYSSQHSLHIVKAFSCNIKEYIPMVCSMRKTQLNLTNKHGNTTEFGM